MRKCIIMVWTLSINHVRNKKLVVFVDSLSCTGCFLNHMMLYYEINDSIISKGGHLVIVFNPRQERIDEIREKIKIDKYPFFCIIDKSGEFKRNNPSLPDNKLLHTFMLDKNDKVIIVGDPSQNSKMNELFLKQLTIL